MAFALAISSFGGIGMVPSAYAAGQTCVWVGTAGDNLFSTAANWTGCGNGVPQDSDIVNIDYANVVNDQLITNDLDVALAGFAPIDGPSGQPSKYIGVTTLKMADGGIVGKEGYDGASLYIDIATSVQPLTFAPITGVGDMTLKHFVGHSNIVTTGTLTLASESYYSYVPGDAFSSLVINNNASVSFGATGTAMTFDKPITLNGGMNSSLHFGGVCQTMGTYMCSVYTPTTWTVSGAITVNAASLIDTTMNTTVIFTGAVNNKALLTNGLNANGTFQFGTTAEVLPVTTVNFDGDALTTSVSVLTNQIGILSGKRQSVTVYNGGILKGTGSIAGQLFVDNGSIVAPGNSPGCLTSETLTLEGEYQFELGGADACTGYDQLIVLNASDVAQPVMIDTGTAILATSRFDGYTPAQGDEFTIINLAGSRAIDGTFNNLPEGTTFEQNGIVFKISYVGGDGNDVVLTVMNQPVAPDTGFALIKANPIMMIIAAGAAAMLALMARSLVSKRR